MKLTSIFPQLWNNYHREEYANVQQQKQIAKRKDIKLDGRKIRWNWLHIQKTLKYSIKDLRKKIGYTRLFDS